MFSLKFYFVVCCSMLLFLSSCAEEIIYSQKLEPNVNSDKIRTCIIVFDIAFQHYDELQVTRSKSEWNDGDKIYLKFNEYTYGVAEFKYGSWVLSYYGELAINESGSCEAFFFENVERESDSIVSLDFNTAPFKATNAKYSYDGTTLYVMANLKPLLGRIRFAGTPNCTITVLGITTHSVFDVSRGSLHTETLPIILTVQSDGYTPYIYGFFTSQDEPILNILSGRDGFSKKIQKTILNKGESGWMNIPTLDFHNGWMKNLYFEVDGIGFCMIPFVRNGSTVICLAETELTEALYAAVNDLSTPPVPNYPHVFGYNGLCTLFLEKLNKLTNLNFRLPTSDEWYYAAKGGNLSQGYTYCGSDDISEVAWYNSNSGGEVHEVSLLKPNELGFYDMSGNLWEWTSNNYLGNYTTCGGAYNETSDKCTVFSGKLNDYTTYSYSGLRVALSINN